MEQASKFTWAPGNLLVVTKGHRVKLDTAEKYTVKDLLGMSNVELQQHYIFLEKDEIVLALENYYNEDRPHMRVFSFTAAYVLYKEKICKANAWFLKRL